MIDIFNMENKLDLTNITCHSGGATGADFFFFETIGEEFGVKTNAYSYKTKYHQSPNKVEISDEDYEDGVKEIKRANIILNRYKIDKFMNLLARNWAQVKYSNQVFAIGQIVNPGQKGSRGYASRAKHQSVDGGTGYAVQMAINNNKDVYVFDQAKERWFRWSANSVTFIELKICPKIAVQNFAGIGTRQINEAGIKAIREVYKKTFNQ